MGRKQFAAEDIIVKLREAEIFLGQGISVDKMLRKIGVSGRPITVGARSMAV